MGRGEERGGAHCRSFTHRTSYCRPPLSPRPKEFVPEHDKDDGNEGDARPVLVPEGLHVELLGPPVKLLRLVDKVLRLPLHVFEPFPAIEDIVDVLFHNVVDVLGGRGVGDATGGGRGRYMYMYNVHVQVQVQQGAGRGQEAVMNACGEARSSVRGRRGNEDEWR